MYNIALLAFNISSEFQILKAIFPYHVSQRFQLLFDAQASTPTGVKTLRNFINMSL